VVVKPPAKNICLDISEEEQQQSKEQGKQNSISGLTPKQPDRRQDRNCPNIKRQIVGTSDESQAQSCGKQEELVPVSLKSDERIDPAANAKKR
jgi:hypothetical protein